MPTLALAKSLWEEYDQLEKAVKSGVHKAMEKFRLLTVAELYADKGLHLESVEQARDPRMRTIRITEFWRGVVLAPDSGDDVFTLIKVVSHDKAYDWAVKQLFTVNSATRGLEVRDAIAIETLTPLLEKAAVESPVDRLFAKYSDTTLRHLGIDDDILLAARTFTDAQQLSAFAKLFPEDQFEVLYYLADDDFDAEDVWRDIVSVRRPAEPGPLDPRDLATAIANTPSRFALVSGPDELEEALLRPFAAWRIFLHPTQRRVAYRTSYSGPAQVTGGPGTGKTVVALHRVKHLLERDRLSGSRILLTTFTNALAVALRENLDYLIDDPQLLARVDVTTVNAFARKVAAKPLPLSDGDEEQSAWAEVRGTCVLPWTEQFLAQEYRHVLLAQDLTSSEDYVRTQRRGRGSALAPTLRPRLWQAAAEFERRLSAAGKQTYLRRCSDAARKLVSAGSPARYAHVVVDEAQDLHPAEWRLLRAAVAEGPDDLFLTGDPHQRIYDSRVSLRSLGIAVAGRTARLRVNYRSTEEILLWSASVLHGESMPDLSGDGTDDLAGYRSLLHGAGPMVRDFTSEKEELEGMLDQVLKWREAGVPDSEIAVAARFHSTGTRVWRRLRDAGVPAVQPREGERSVGKPGVRIVTAHSLKGLEYRCVAVLGVNDRSFPLARAVTLEEVDRLQHASDLQAERCLLFVACTRARDALYVSWSGGSPSTLLPAAPTG